jgi:hypothetical protein
MAQKPALLVAVRVGTIAAPSVRAFDDFSPKCACMVAAALRRPLSGLGLNVHAGFVL